MVDFWHKKVNELGLNLLSLLERNNLILYKIKTKKFKKKIYCLGISVAMEMSRKIGLLPSPR